MRGGVAVGMETVQQKPGRQTLENDSWHGRESAFGKSRLRTKHTGRPAAVSIGNDADSLLVGICSGRSSGVAQVLQEVDTAFRPVARREGRWAACGVLAGTARRQRELEIVQGSGPRRQSLRGV